MTEHAWWLTLECWPCLHCGAPFVAHSTGRGPDATDQSRCPDGAGFYDRNPDWDPATLDFT